MSDYKITTPIDSFINLETGSQVELVSLVHVGTPQYYQQLGRYIMGKQDEGFTVQYEEVASEAIPDKSGRLDRVKMRIQRARMDQVANGYVAIELGSGYTAQDYDQLFRTEGSERRDITDLDAIQKSSLLTLALVYAEARLSARKLKEVARKSPDKMDDKVFDIIKSNVDGVSKKKLLPRPGNKVTIKMRNQAALEGVDDALVNDQAARLVLIWGLGHLAGLEAGLLERGYEHVERHEVDLAVHMPRLEKSMRENQAEIDRRQAKIARAQARLESGPRRLQFPRRLQTMTPMQKLLADDERRSKELLRDLDKERIQLRYIASDSQQDQTKRRLVERLLYRTRK